MFVVENFFHTRDAAHLWGFEGRLPHVLGRQGVVGPPTDRGSQEPGFWDLFDLEFRSMEGEGEIGYSSEKFPLALSRYFLSIKVCLTLKQVT